MLYEQMKRNIGITPEEADAKAAKAAAGKDGADRNSSDESGGSTRQMNAL